MKRLVVAVMLMLAFVAVATVAEGAEQRNKSPFATVFGKTLPPIGFVRFCMQTPEACQTENRIVDRTQMTAAMWQDLRGINVSVNTAIRPVSDEELYGVPEFWTYPLDSGDCEDFLLLKKRQLEKLGFAASTLLITVVMDEKNEGHAVLTVVTDKGDYVLDNRRNELLLWNETGYKFLKRQSQDNARIWVALAKQKTDNAQQVSSGE
jgi:predicted transglutaminase-like cysteine proteinase